MTWHFRYTEIASGAAYVEPHATWQDAHAALRGFIATVHPPASFNALQKECENFSIDTVRSITDGHHVFGVERENA